MFHSVARRDMKLQLHCVQEETVVKVIKHIYYMTGSASGQDGPILPARDFPRWSLKSEILLA